MTRLRRAVRRGHAEQGSAVPLALISLLATSMLGAAFMALSTTGFTVATNWRGYNAAFYAADAGLESGVVNLRALLQTTPNPTSGQLAAITPPTLTSSAATISAYSITAANVTPYKQTFMSGAFGGMIGNVRDYVINAQATTTDGMTANLNQTVRYVQVPLFQFAIFYGKGVALEFGNGAPMTIVGRVHSNSDMYLGPQSSLNFDGRVTSAGHIHRSLLRAGTPPPFGFGNNPQIKDAGGVDRTLNFDHDRSASGTSWTAADWAAAANSLFGGNLQDSAMGIQQIVPPGSSELFSDGVSNPDVLAHKLIERVSGMDSATLRDAKLGMQADLRIIDGVAYNRSGTSWPGTSTSLPPGITTRTFWDAREGRTMTVTQVDVGALRASGQAPPNGILYVSGSGAGAGVRLVNGEQLPSQGFTVASDNPVYVQGDYNTINKVSAAIMGDAITVLSNNWGPNNSDTKGDQITTNRPASTTTVNAAFAMGPSAESVEGTGNGQVENSIRFLENWAGSTINYKGSLVNLWHSQQATAAWRCCGAAAGQYYNPPIRNLSYETLFDTTPPPGTPMGTIIVKGQWAQK